MTLPPPADCLKTLADFSLPDLEAVRLILRGDSVIDWHRLNFTGEGEVERFLAVQELSLADPSDRARIEHVKDQAIAFLRRHFSFPVPKPIERSSVPELFMLATGQGHKQMCACTILKCMHIIHHLDGRELLFMLPLSDQELFHLVEEKVYRVIGGMLASSFPILEFVGGRKNKDSLYTKLLSKPEVSAAQVYDKLRFRVVTRGKGDIFPVMQYLTTHLFPFSYVVPGQSINSVFHFKSYCEADPNLAPMLPEMQGAPDDDLTPSDNRFSAHNYRVIHFVVDMPVKIPKAVLERAPHASERYGEIVFAVCEFQVVDRETETLNELGEASHARYKERQKQAVMRRLQLGLSDTVSHPPASKHNRESAGD